MKKVVIELDKNLTENEILIYKEGKLFSVDIHELLVPEINKLRELEKNILQYQEEVNKNLNTMAKAIKTLIGE